MRKRIRNVMAGVVIGPLLAMGGVAAAHATTTYPEGGTHQYGVYTGSAEEARNYSNYHHPANWHRSSVKVTNGNIYRSGDQPKGVWAKVDRETGWVGNQAFYFKYSY
jgi:lactococcin 972 family bacteriocin